MRPRALRTAVDRRNVPRVQSEPDTPRRDALPEPRSENPTSLACRIKVRLLAERQDEKSSQL